MFVKALQSLWSSRKTVLTSGVSLPHAFDPTAIACFLYLRPGVLFQDVYCTEDRKWEYEPLISSWAETLSDKWPKTEFSSLVPVHTCI